jgi:hypothetical protein
MMLKYLSHPGSKWCFSRTKIKMIALHTSSSIGRTLWPPFVSTKTAACLIGHTSNLSILLGSNCTFKTGHGNLYFCSHSPDNISQIQTVLSVDADAILYPDLDQLMLHTG